ncbi:Uncharacterized protein TPAR_08314 [Tolypocladium paradoxum]|uniref:Clr5 domain-containing protein n=1 Tax=Tolypocladium paradoxum TaxID=94208 RepID=A0A2S4KMS9_9HYPO|nr:Uncharacterized protein TPAR_08314 [Tolypocladium paradoxum]
MTKPWETHRREMVQLYAQHTLEVVMEVMRTRHQFDASRRSYMEYFAKWGVRKYKRKGRQVVVHNSRTDDDDDDDDGQARRGDDAAGGEHAEPSSSQAPSHGTQSLVLPYASHGLPAEHRHQHQGHIAAQDWGYFHAAWPVQETSMQEYDPSMDVTQQYLAAAHQPPSAVGASRHDPAPADDSEQARGPSHHVRHRIDGH